MPTTREFFVQEANDYVQRLSALVQGATAAGIDAAGLQRLARRLRGTAQMARETRVHTIAHVLESLSRALQTQTLVWGLDVQARITQTLEDVAHLVGAGEDDGGGDARVASTLARWRELGVAVPDGPVAAAGAAQPASGDAAFDAFAARETAAIVQELAAAIAALERDARGREPLKALLRRQASLLGAAQLGRYPTLSEALQAIEDITRVIARNDVTVEGGWLELYRAAHQVIAPLIDAAAPDRLPPAAAQPGPALERLRAVRDGLLQAMATEEPAAAAAPAQEEVPVEVVNFFRNEAAALLERVQRMAAELASANAEKQNLLRRELREALTALRDTARTFGFAEVARLAETGMARAAGGTPAEVGELVPPLRASVAAARPGAVPASAPAPAAAPMAPAPTAAPAPAPAATPAPAAAAVEDVVPIESLLYRGQPAVQRALELRGILEREPAGSSAAREALEELIDLVRIGAA